MPAIRRTTGRLLVPRTAVHMRQLQRLKVPVIRRQLACAFLPLTDMFAQQPQHLEVLDFRLLLLHPRITVPRIAVRARASASPAVRTSLR